MDYAYQVQNKITELLAFKISFNEVDKSYLFNDKQARETNTLYYSEKIQNIKYLLFQQLKNGTNHKEFLQNLLDLFWGKIEYIEGFKCFSSVFFELYAKNIVLLVNASQGLAGQNKELFENYKTYALSANNENNDLFDFLNFIAGGMNHFQNDLDFEKGLLLHALETYRETLTHLYQYIYSIHMNIDYTDFKKLEFKGFEKDKISLKSTNLIHINLEKKSIAHLFRFFLEEEIFVFDTSSNYHNELKMKQFVEDNFTFLNNEKKKVGIKRLNREYSESGSKEPEELIKQQQMFNHLINLLENRRNQVIKILQKNS